MKTLLESIFEAVDADFEGSDERGSFDDEIETACRGFEIDSKSYIQWVQRSLNRLVGSKLAVDGKAGPRYRDAVLAFQKKVRLPATGNVDSKTQNQLILGNEKNAGYVRSIQQALNQKGARIAVDGIKGPGTTAAIKAFQRTRSPDLCVDGFVGAKTELLLLEPKGGGDRDLSCGVPTRSVLRELELEFELESELEPGAEEQGPAPATVRSRLCLFQNHSTTTHRNHFQCGAVRQARRIGAIASPNTGNCRRRVGATPYDTGADIIRFIQAARRCRRQRVDQIHVFSHGFSSGIPGTTAGSAGIYRTGFGGVDRAAGGRLVTNVPAADLAENVTVVLHGCNMAAGTENVARSLYQHLARTLDNPRVYGHYNTGCAGRNNSWREYSNRHPTGRRLATLPNIASTGCCGP